MSERALSVATITAFADELGKIKEALSLSQLQGVAAPITKRLGPGGVVQATQRAAAPAGRSLKDTLRGQVVPGVADMRRDFAAVQQANQQLQGARSLLQ